MRARAAAADVCAPVGGASGRRRAEPERRPGRYGEAVTLPLGTLPLSGVLATIAAFPGAVEVPGPADGEVGEMRAPDGATLSEDGHYWWDGEQWQVNDDSVAGAADAGDAAAGGVGHARAEADAVATSAGGAAGGAAAQPAPEVVLTGTAGFDPPFPRVGHPIEYTWSEVNIGGDLTEPYHAKVDFKDPDGQIIDSDLVECAALTHMQEATRSKTLSAPTKATIGYSIELWVDVDHNANFSEGLNYAYHNVDADEDS